MILTNETDPILKVLRHHTCDGFVPPIPAIEAAACFRQAGGLGRLLRALQRVAEIDLSLLGRTAGFQPETIAWGIVSSFPADKPIDRQLLREKIAAALAQRP